MPGAPLAVGFFGKIPSTGDFVATGLPRGFIDRWDRWMSMELARRPGDEAYDAYGWRFRVRAGLFGELPASGVWRISADRVGTQSLSTLKLRQRRPSPASPSMRGVGAPRRMPPP